MLLPSNYRNNNYNYLKNVSITEYDMKSGGLNILREKGFISDDEAEKLELLDKSKKNIAIGKLEISNKELRISLNNGFKEYVTQFITDNKIPIESILTIKKDAVFLINQNPTKLKFGRFIEFRPKNIYTSYCCLNNKEFYYNGALNILDVKGFGLDIAEKSANGVLKDIKSFMRMNEKFDYMIVFNALKEYRSNYLNLKLPVESYRDLDTGTFKYKGHNLEIISEKYLNDIDINDTFIKYINEFIKLLV